MHTLDVNMSLLLEDTDLKSQFESLISTAAGANVIAQQQLFAILAQFVPVTFCTDNSKELRYVKQLLRLLDLAISTAKFVKPPENDMQDNT